MKKTVRQIRFLIILILMCTGINFAATHTIVGDDPACPGHTSGHYYERISNHSVTYAGSSLGNLNISGQGGTYGSTHTIDPANSSATNANDASAEVHGQTISSYASVSASGTAGFNWEKKSTWCGPGPQTTRSLSHTASLTGGCMVSAECDNMQGTAAEATADASGQASSTVTDDDDPNAVAEVTAAQVITAKVRYLTSGTSRENSGNVGANMTDTGVNSSWSFKKAETWTATGVGTATCTVTFNQAPVGKRTAEAVCGKNWTKSRSATIVLTGEGTGVNSSNGDIKFDATGDISTGV